MKVGILGGGQLAQMLAVAGIRLGIECFFYVEEEPSSVLKKLGPIFIGKYKDEENLKNFASQVDVVTFENENIPFQILEKLQKHKSVYPDKNAIRLFQDRFLEKTIFNELAIPTNRFMQVNTPEDLVDASKTFSFPFMLKKRSQGYDGRGQVKIHDVSDLENVEQHYFGSSIAEEFVKFDREVSLIGARNREGEIVFYDICENVHKNGILHKTLNRQNDPLFGLAREYVEKIMLEINYVGVITLEFFQKNNKLFANEVAPRVHNSGHWTIDASTTSQFENHLRCILNLPLGNTKSLVNCCMYNIIGAMPKIEQVLSFENARLYDYKKLARPGRKLGHCTVLNYNPTDSSSDLEQLLTLQ